MADNYLERQMEQYEARKKAWEKSKKTQVKRPAKKTPEAQADVKPQAEKN
jgi:hypothetical protein